MTMRRLRSSPDLVQLFESEARSLPTRTKGLRGHCPHWGLSRTSRRERKKVEMLFAHLKRILKLERLRLRGPNGARDEFHLAAAAQNLRKLATLIPLQQLSPA